MHLARRRKHVCELWVEFEMIPVRKYKLTQRQVLDGVIDRYAAAERDTTELVHVGHDDGAEISANLDLSKNNLDQAS